MTVGRGYRGHRRSEPRAPRAHESQRTLMLNLNRVTSFRYAIREIMEKHEVSEGVASSVVASVIAKGSRISIDSAREHVLEQERAGMYSREVSDEILDLLDRHSRHR